MDLSTAARERLSPGQFAIPAKAKSKKARGKSGNYPIPDAAHARAALELVGKNGTPDEKKEVDRAVHKKFPGIG